MGLHGSSELSPLGKSVSLSQVNLMQYSRWFARLATNARHNICTMASRLVGNHLSKLTISRSGKHTGHRKNQYISPFIIHGPVSPIYRQGVMWLVITGTNWPVPCPGGGKRAGRWKLPWTPHDGMYTHISGLEFFGLHILYRRCIKKSSFNKYRACW